MKLRGPRNLATFENHHIHDGEGYAVVRRLFTETEFWSGLCFFNESSLQPGASYGDHPHTESEEVYYIVEGCGLVQVDGEARPVGPGDAVLTQPGSHHSLRNTGDRPLKVLVVSARVPRHKQARPTAP